MTNHNKEWIALSVFSMAMVAIGAGGVADSMCRWRESVDFDGFPKSAPDHRKVVMIAGGDINVGRHAGATLEKLGLEGAMGEVLPILRQGDLLFANLECTLTTATKSRKKSGKSWLIKALPANRRFLEELEFDVLHLANNHMKDYLCTGIRDTISNLKKTNIAFGGAGRNLDEAARPVILTKNGLKIAFIFLSTTSPSTAAANDRCGIHHISIGKDLVAAQKELRQQVRKLRAQADVVLMSIHWGVPFKRGETTQSMIDFGHMAIDEGVHAVVGHGNHELIGMERYKGRPIVYDMGNFYFDMDDVTWVNRQGYWRWEMDGSGVGKVGFTPYVLERKSMIAQLPSADVAQATYERVAESTEKFGSQTYREGEWLFLR